MISLRIACLVSCVFIFVQGVAADFNSAGPIQIVSPVNHTFQLELDELRHILEADEIKDRSIVVVSISGAFRKGKSFLLNFFLKYLYAQYEKHDVSDWIGENGNDRELIGFKWRSGRTPETTGILMWSDIFTYDYENGEKVAILLLDTQGIFDGRTSQRECTTIFALTTLLSSVECYNLMQNIQEDDLQNLHLYTEYARHALEQTNEKPFQYLLFIVRDWPYAFETDYGLYGQEILSDFFAKNDEQTPEMRKLRRQLNASFEEIGAFLMPHPGLIVAHGRNFTGVLKQIDPDFIKYIKELAPALLAPDNLVVKKINGQAIRARDFIAYLQAYLDVFTGDSLPEPKTIDTATTETYNQILCHDGLNSYIDTMQNALNTIETYLTDTEFLNLHQKLKSDAITQFRVKSKFGGDEMISTFQRRLEGDIEAKLPIFANANKQKFENFVEKSKLHNEKIINRIEDMSKAKMVRKMNESESSLSKVDLFASFQRINEMALQEFNMEKMGDDEIARGFREQLERGLRDLENRLDQMFTMNENLIQIYGESMQKSIELARTYLNETELENLHQKIKNEIIAQFEERFGCDDLMSAFKQRFRNEVDRTFPNLKWRNEDKRKDFIEKANAHNKQISREIEEMIKEGSMAEISKIYLDEYALNSLFLGMKEVALEMFDAQKMCDGNVSKQYRDGLEQNLINFRSTISTRNQRKRGHSSNFF